MIKTFAFILITFYLPYFLTAQTVDYVITDFGAENDDLDDTEAVQAAIDKCSENGGDNVIFPAGKWHTGTIYLQNNVSIYLAKGAIWQGLDKDNAYFFIEPVVKSREDRYPRRAMIYAYQKKNIKIFGEGLLYPGGDYEIFEATPEESKYYERPFGICMIECENIQIEGITLKNSAFWMQRYFQCNNLKISDITVFNHSNLNNDGIDVDGCHDVIIQGCVIDASDDALVLKSEGERACENITINNCILSSHATSLKLGTGSVGGFKNITISNIVIKPSKSKEMHHILNAWGGLSGIDILCVDGGTIENVAISNVTMDGVETPLFIKLGNRNSAWEGKTDFEKSTIRNIKIDNIIAVNTGRITSSITGYEGKHVENVTLSNIRFESIAYEGNTGAELEINERSDGYPFNRMYGFDYPVYGFYVNYADNITFNNVEFVKNKTDLRPALKFENTTNSRLIQVRTSEKEYEKFDIEVDNSWNSKSKYKNMLDVIIDTDLGGDPDDIQSLFRAVHYSDIIKIKGIVSTPRNNKEAHPWDTIKNIDLIKHWIKRIDVEQIRANGFSELMPEKELLSVVKAGSSNKGAPSGKGTTEGSNWIIETARKYNKDNPLWVLVWGSITTTAQALHDAPDIADKIRIYYIGTSNTLHDPASRDFIFDFMQKNYSELWWIECGILPKGSRETQRGIYQSGLQEGEWSYTSFIDHNIRNHGSNHDGLFEEKCGDVFPVAKHPPNSLKEGDSPSILFLISPIIGNIGSVDDPTEESWGGQFRHYDKDKFPNYYIDLDLPPAECQWTIGKWRYDILKAWKQRWDRYEKLK